MEEINPSDAPEGLIVEVVEWLPSGGRSGLVRVRGRWTAGAPVDASLPALLVDDGGTVHRFASLPDPRGDRTGGRWRGAYVVNADLLEDARSVAIEFQDGRTAALPVPEAEPPDPDPESDLGPGGELIDRAVLAERRARRAEESVEAQARTAREAMRAVEALEARASGLEDQLAVITSERDALADQAASLTPPAEVEALRRRLEEQAELAATLEAQVAQLREPPAEGEADRAERLREALAEAVTTIGELRTSLREAHLARRTNDVERSANAVRLVVVESERADLAARLAAASEEIRQAHTALTEAHRLTRGAEAAHDETRRRFAERVAELLAARARIEELEREMATLRERAAADARAALAEREAELEARRRGLQDELDSQLADMESRVAEERAAREATEADLLERLAGAESALARAQTARELAEAAAVAADAERRSATVAAAARMAKLEARLGGVEPRGAGEPAPEPELPAVTEPEPQARPLRLVGPPPVIPAELLGSSDPLTPARAAVVADLDRAAAQLRAAEPGGRPEPEPDSPGPKIISARTHPPRQVATGSGRRSYPPLRGALVKLAHDDPEAAAELVLGLARAQWRCLERPLDYDLTIGDGTTHRVEVTAGTATITPIDFPREWGDDYFHLHADAAAIAEMVAGVVRLRRFGAPQVSGSRRAARALNAIGRSQVSLADAVRDGAEIEPALALRCLEYAVPLAWTRGHDFVVEERITSPGGDEVLYVIARDGRGVAVTRDAPDRQPDATVVLSRSAFAAMLRGEPPREGERPAVRGDHDVVDVLREWAERVRTSDF